MENQVVKKVMRCAPWQMILGAVVGGLIGWAAGSLIESEPARAFMWCVGCYGAGGYIGMVSGLWKLAFDYYPWERAK